MDFSSLTREALSVQFGDFIELVKKTTSLLQKEKGKIGNLTITEHLVKLEPLGEALVVGDLHGDLDSLLVILRKSNFIEKMEKARRCNVDFSRGLW